MISVLILTRDEERNLGACLESLKWSDDIVVLDSCSTDRTAEIARSWPNVRVCERPFDTEWKQRNFGLHQIKYKYPWVYICDADERVSHDLVQEMRQVVAGSASHVAYRLRFRNMFLGQWIRDSSGYPVWIIRLVRPDKVRYEQRATNVHPIVDGSVGELREHFDHFSFGKGVIPWFRKHNYYSTREASEGVRVRREGFPPMNTILSRDPMRRRRAMKNLSYFVVGRGIVRFWYSYLFRGGFLEAEFYEEASGAAKWGWYLTKLYPGNWAKYANVDFGTGVETLTAHIAVPDSYAGQRLELHLDAVDGPVIGSLIDVSTGGWEMFAQQSTAVSGASGMHDLFLVAAGTLPFAGIDWFTFA